MIGAITCLLVPSLTKDAIDTGRNYLILFLWGVLIDLMAGTTLGLTSVFFILELAISILFSRKIKIGLFEKLVIGVPSAIVYFYVSRRYFW